jgi:hypothetical protein
VKELLSMLLPGLVDLATDYVKAQTDEDRDEVRRRAERAQWDKLKEWDAKQGAP